MGCFYNEELRGYANAANDVVRLVSRPAVRALDPSAANFAEPQLAGWPYAEFTAIEKVEVAFNYARASGSKRIEGVKHANAINDSSEAVLSEIICCQ